MGVQLALIGGVSLIGIGIFAWVMFTKEPPKPAPTPPPPKKVESKPASKPSGPLVKDLPPEVRSELYQRLAKLSDKVDALERQQQQVEAITDPAERLEKLRAIHEEYSAISEGIVEVLEDPKYEKYRKDETYGPNFASYETRLKYYTNKMNDLRKKEQAASAEVAQQKLKATTAAKDATASKPAEK
jgi:uncharacterized coiled-coil DUF342 family protein